MADLSFLDPNMNSTDETPLGAVSPDLSFLDPDQNVRPSDPTPLINARELTHGMDPQRTAKVIDLSRRAGLPPRIVEERMDEIERREMLNDGLLADVASKAPKTTSFLSDPDRFAVAQADIENLAELEGLMSYDFFGNPMDPNMDANNPLAKELIADPFMAITKGLLRAPGQLLEGAANIFSLPVGAIASAVEGYEQLTGVPAGGYFSDLQDATTSAAKWIRENMVDIEPLRISEDLRGKGVWDSPEVLLDPEWVAYTTTDILPSIGASIAAYLAGGPLAAGLVGGGMEGGSLQAELLEEGMEPWKANVAGQVFGLVTGALNAIGADKVLGKGVSKSLKHRLFKGFFIKGGVEGTTEWAEEFLQPLVAGIARGDSRSEIAAAMVEGAKRGLDVFVPSLITGGLMGTATERMEYQKAQFAAKEQEVLDMLTENVAQSKLAQLDPVLYQEALTVLKEGGKISDIHIPASAIMSYNLAEVSEVLNQLGVSFETFDLALNSGGTVAIPVEKYGAAIAANPDLAVRFANDRKLSADGYTRNELAQFNQEWAQEAKRVLQLAAETEELKDQEDAETKAIYEQVYAARQAAGRVPDAARLDAAQFTAALVSMAKMSEGKYTATQLFEAYMPRVTAGQPIVDQQTPGRERQAGDFTVNTEDAGVISARVIRSENGAVSIFTDKSTTTYNAEFAGGKTDEEIISYAFEPLGVIGVSATPIVDQQTLQQDAAFAGVENEAEVEEARRLWAEMGVESPYFKRWAGGAPVVLKNAAPSFATGQAVVVEADHGSPDIRFVQEDGIFKSEKERYGFGRSEAAFWFSRDTATAKTYADPRRAFDYQNAEPGIVSAFVRLNNPLVVDAAGQNWRDAQKRGKTSDVIREARENGHDGVIIYNVKDDYNNDKKTRPTTTLTVFSSTQIKSVNNRGTFDPADARIQYQSLSPEAQAMADRIAQALNQPVGPEPDAEVAVSPTLYQVQNLPEWKVKTRTWMEKNGYTAKEIEKHLGAIEGQMRIFAALGPMELEMLPKGAGLAKRYTKDGVPYEGPLRENVDPIYKITFDASAMCVKRLEAAATANYVQARIGRALTTSERMALVALFRSAGKAAPCIYCYVEAPRAKSGEFVKTATDVVFGVQDTPKHTSGKKKGQEKWSAATLSKARAAQEEAKALGLSPSDVDPNVLLDPEYAQTEEAKAKEAAAPAIYKFLRSQQLNAKSNLPKLYEEYDGQILGLPQELLDELNGYAGLRFFSSSDFQAEHVADLMQAVFDMEIRQAKAHAYTKVPDFVRIFGGTGIKIQTSVFAKEVNGEIVMDDWQGMNWDDAKAFREQYDNVGTVLVATSDAIVLWAKQQDWIDYIIPFHWSGLEKKFYTSMDWQDFTSTQTEQPLVPGETIKKIRMHETGSAAGISNEQGTRNYLTLAMERGIVPVFPAFLFKDFQPTGDRTLDAKNARARWELMAKSGEIDWDMIDPEYYKLRKDYARTDTPFSPVQSNIDVDMAEKILGTFLDGTAPKAKVDTAIADRLIGMIRESETTGADIGVEALRKVNEGQTLFQQQSPLGFDGIFVPRAQATKGVAVLLGDHAAVPVDLVQGQPLYQNDLGIDKTGPGGILKEKEVVYEKADRGEDSVSARGGEGVYSEERGMRPLPGARLVELRSTEKRSVPATVVSPRHAAAAMSFLSDAPQEQLSALVLDKNGKPLAILSHSLGNIDSTQVDNRALLGAIQDVAGAKSFYLVHNHPAETAVLSSADRGLSENIRIINEGSGLSYGGIIAVTPSGYGDEFGDNQSYPPPGKQKKVPVVQRMFVKADRVQGLGPVSSPEDIKSNISTITGGAESGIILLSNNNVPIGFLPLDPAEMSRLRGDRLGEVLKSFHRTNATGIVGILPNEASLSAWRNVAAMANAINARPLDALFRNGAGSLDSARMQGKDVDSYGSKAFLQQQGEPQAAFTFKTASGKPLIELFRTANQSSFLHETGHLYLEMVRELALQENAPAPVTALWAQTKAALKIDDGPISREAHEEWARNLEAYFLEGAAPSLGLRKIFAQYAQWLRSIYKQVEQIFLQSGTQFNEDLKPVFDRIFASETDIEEARSFYSSQKPFFAALDPKVMAKEREKYEERRMRARESMEDKRLRQLTEAWVKVSGGKGKIRAEVAEEVKARPVMAVIKAAAAGIDMKALDATVGEDLRKKLKAVGRYSSLVKKEGTVDPDILAAENGYDSVVAMVEDLISFPGEKAAIAAGVEARMEAERQRISRGLAETDLAADEAYHNDDQLAVLVAEFEILSQQAAQKTKRLEAAMVRDVARQLLASEKVNFATQSSRFARLERRAAKLARAAYERGDAKAAADYKRQEMLNHAMFIESVKLKEGIKKTAARIKRGIQKTKGISPEVKTLLQGLGIQYGILPYKKERDPVRAFEMWNQDLVAKGGKIPTIEGWVDEMRKLGISAPLDPFLNNAAAVPYQQITVGQFRALEEGVRILRRVDRGLHTVTWIDGSTITMEDAIERLQAHVAGRGGKAPDPLTYDPNAVTLAARNFFAEHTKASTIIQALDNWEAGGLFYQLIYRPVMDADSDLSARWAAEAPKIKALFEPIRRQLRKKVVVLGKARPRAQLVAAALNVGNQGNRERLIAGLGINEAQLDQLLAPLTTEEMDFVQAVWDYIATFKDEAFAVERRLTGREPAAVDPVPFVFKGKTYAGGYYPVSYDKNLRDQKGEARDAKEALDELFGGTPAGTAMTAHGHLEARASAGTGERLSQELSVISDHVAQVLRDITHREAMVNVAKLLKNKQIMAMITDVVGREKAKQLWPWLVSVSKEGREQIQLTAVEKMLLHFRPAMTFYTQAYKVGTALMQAAGFLQVFEFVQAKHVGQAVWQLYGKGLLSLNMFSDGEIISHPLIKEIREKSPQMNERLLNADRDIRDATKEFSTSESALATYKKAGFKATVAMQFYVADVVAWQGAYLQALTDGMTEKDAINRADFVVEQAMGAGYTRALSKIQRGGSIQRFLTMFYTFGSVLYNLAARRAGITKKQLASGQYGAAALGASSFLVLQWVMPVLLEALVRGDVADDDDDETLAEKLLVNLLTYPAQSVLIARELSGIAKGFKYRFSPALKPFESVGQWISSVARAIEQEDASIAAKPTAQLVGTTTGLIPAQFINSGEVLTDYLTGEDQELSVRELLYGKRRQ